jgi:uncharacterized protein YndB with AHSA1/START domain
MKSAHHRLPAMIAGITACLLSVVSAAAELRTVEVDRDTDLNQYSLRSVTWFDASPESIYRVLADYDLFHRFTSAIVESHNMEEDEQGRPGYYTRMEGCVLMWCRSFIRIGHLTLVPNTRIVANADPEQSNFKRSRESWTLTKEGEGTLLVYEFEMVPDFWVPPVIGPFFIKRALQSGGEKAVDRIEALAQGSEPAGD